MDEHKVKVTLSLKPTDREYLEFVAREYNLTSISAAIAFVIQAFRSSVNMAARYDKIRKG